MFAEKQIGGKTTLSHRQPVVSLEFPRNKGRNKTVFLDPFILHYHNDLGFVGSFHVYLTVLACLCFCAQQGVFLLPHCRSPHSGAQRLKKRAHAHTLAHCKSVTLIPSRASCLFIPRFIRFFIYFTRCFLMQIGLSAPCRSVGAAWDPE